MNGLLTGTEACRPSTPGPPPKKLPGCGRLERVAFERRECARLAEVELGEAREVGGQLHFAFRRDHYALRRNGQRAIGVAVVAVDGS